MDWRWFSPEGVCCIITAVRNDAMDWLWFNPEGVCCIITAVRNHAIDWLWFNPEGVCWNHRHHSCELTLLKYAQHNNTRNWQRSKLYMTTGGCLLNQRNTRNMQYACLFSTHVQYSRYGIVWKWILVKWRLSAILSITTHCILYRIILLIL